MHGAAFVGCSSICIVSICAISIAHRCRGRRRRGSLLRVLLLLLQGAAATLRTAEPLRRGGASARLAASHALRIHEEIQQCRGQNVDARPDATAPRGRAPRPRETAGRGRRDAPAGKTAASREIGGGGSAPRAPRRRVSFYIYSTVPSRCK
eukprot:3266365-Prymnesium_polylepis.1